MVVARGAAMAAGKYLASPQGQAVVAAAATAVQKMNSSKKTSNNGARRRVSKRQAKLNRSFQMLSAQSGVHEICAITNPFCDESKGSRWPDGSAGYSVPFPQRYRFYVSTDSTGRAAVLTTVNPRRSMYTAATFTGPNDVVDGWNGQNIDDAAFSAGNFSSVRVVSSGVKFVCTLAPMYASGSVTMIEVPPNEEESNINAYLSFSLTQQNKPTYVTMPLRDNRALYGLHRPSGPDARSFGDLDYIVDPGAVPPVEVASYSTFDWSSLIFYIKGAPANTTVGFVDVFLNLEYEVIANSTLGTFARPAPVEDKVAMQGNQYLTRQLNMHVGDDATVDESFIGKASRFLSGVGRTISNNLPALLEFGTSYNNARTSSNMAAGARLVGSMRGMSIRDVD